MTDKKENERRIDCPLTDFPDCFIVMPKHWLGEHAVKRDEAIMASKEYKSIEITNFSICLHVLNEFKNIPGIEGDDPKKWRLDKTPLIIITWLSEVVQEDFHLAYDVPKNS